MRKFVPFLFWFPLLAGLALAQPQGRTVEEVWEVAHLEGTRVGYFRTLVQEIQRPQGKVLRTTQRMDLTLKRYGAMVRVQVENGTEETPEGMVKAVFLRMPQENGEMVLNGTVTEKGLHVRVDDGRIDKYVRWNDQVVGLYRQERFFQERRFKTGDAFSYLSYEPTINYVVTVRGKVGAEEEVTMLQGRQRLLRIEAAPDKVEYAGGSVELPGLVAWLDKKGTIVRRQMELPGLGQVISYRTSREMALAQGPLTRLDIGEKTFIPLNRGLSQPHRTGNVVYRIRLKGEKDLSTAIAQDARQEIKNLKDNTFELHVRALRSPEEVADPTARTKEEFLNSCYFLKCDDPRVQALTRQAVDGTTDPLKKARRIERWVHENMRHDNRSNFAPADEVARTLKGDCRQHALLTAAMCRAAGVPSRTAVGLVYGTDANRRPVMAFHMWTEVWVKGQWFAIDATLGQGSIGAAHIKIADHSWYDTQSLTPLLPVVRVLGKMEIEVVSVNGMPGGMKEEG